MAAPRVVQVPVDLVEFEARLVALERRLREAEDRDRLLLGVAEGVRRLTEALGPLLEAVGSGAVSPAPARYPPTPPAPTQAPVPPAPALSPERLAQAQARMRAAAAPALPGPGAPPPGRRSWLLRALRRLGRQDPQAAAELLAALRPAHRLAGLDTAPELPQPAATVARVIVRGRVRRRLGWERAGLDCELRTVAALAKLARLPAAPAALQAAGVVLEPPSAMKLVACLIEPRWTASKRFTIAHADSGAWLEVRAGLRPAAGPGPRLEEPATAIRCRPEDLLAVLAGDGERVAEIEGDREPLEFVYRWLARATSVPLPRRATAA
jgi:hypothetical protein